MHQYACRPVKYLCDIGAETFLIEIRANKKEKEQLLPEQDSIGNGKGW
jgi:hypothetical protein